MFFTARLWEKKSVQVKLFNHCSCKTFTFFAQLPVYIFWIKRDGKILYGKIEMKNFSKFFWEDFRSPGKNISFHISNMIFAIQEENILFCRENCFPFFSCFRKIVWGQLKKKCNDIGWNEESGCEMINYKVVEFVRTRIYWNLTWIFNKLLLPNVHLNMCWA